MEIPKGIGNDDSPVEWLEPTDDDVTVSETGRQATTGCSIRAKQIESNGDETKRNEWLTSRLANGAA